MPLVGTDPDVAADLLDAGRPPHNGCRFLAEFDGGYFSKRECLQVLTCFCSPFVLHTSMTVKALTAALLADRDRPGSPTHNIVPCFVCGYTFVYRGRRDDLNGRFCSLRCRDWYDA